MKLVARFPLKTSIWLVIRPVNYQKKNRVILEWKRSQYRDKYCLHCAICSRECLQGILIIVYPAILTQQDWSIKDLLLYGQYENLFLRYQRGKSRVDRARWTHLAPLG